MKKKRRRATRHPGIARIDQPSTRTHGWFVRTGFYRLRKGTYAPRHRKFFGDVSHGGKRRALEAAKAYLATVSRKRPRKRRRRDLPAAYRATAAMERRRVSP